MCSDRAQLSLSVVEAGIGTLLILAVIAGFGVDLTDERDASARLDRHAVDALRVLSAESGTRPGESRLASLARSATAFDRRRDATRRRAREVLPERVLFRIETPHGVVGYPTPRRVPVGRASVPTLYGTVTMEVWFA